MQTTKQVAQEAYNIWRGNHLCALDYLPPHWDDLDWAQKELLTFVVLHVAATAMSKEQ